jgi:hypothetical protein
MATTAGPVTPLDMIICDGAHRDPGSGKWTLLGIFNSITTSAFPTAHPQFIVYLALKCPEGKVPLSFRLVAADRRDEPLFRADAELTVQDAAAVSELAVPFRGLAIPRPGEYLLQVLADGNVIIERSFTARLAADRR